MTASFLDNAQWLFHGAALGLGLFVLSLVGSVLPWRRQRTVECAMVLPYAREDIWQAYFANQTMRTPGVTFDTAAPDTLIEYDVRVGEHKEVTCAMTARVMVNEHGRHYALNVLTFDGKPFPGGPQSFDGIKLEYARGTPGTRVTILLHVETPNLLHAWLMRKAVRIALAKLRHRLALSGARKIGVGATT